VTVVLAVALDGLDVPTAQGNLGGALILSRTAPDEDGRQAAAGWVDGFMAAVPLAGSFEVTKLPG
jgi:hypothetical protein